MGPAVLRKIGTVFLWSMWSTCASWALVIGTWFAVTGPPGAALDSNHLELGSAIWAIWIAMTMLTITLVRRSGPGGWVVLGIGFLVATLYSMVIDTPRMKQYLNLLNSRHVRSARVELLHIDTRTAKGYKGSGSYSYEIAVLRHPWKKDATIEFSAEDVPGKPGDRLCVPIYAGLKGQWAGAPIICTAAQTP